MFLPNFKFISAISAGVFPFNYLDCQNYGNYIRANSGTAGIYSNYTTVKNCNISLSIGGNPGNGIGLNGANHSIVVDNLVNMKRYRDLYSRRRF